MRQISFKDRGFDRVLAELNRQEFERFGKLIRDAKIKLD
jgi:hypothetical protein